MELAGDAEAPLQRRHLYRQARSTSVGETAEAVARPAWADADHRPDVGAPIGARREETRGGPPVARRRWVVLGDRIGIGEPELPTVDFRARTEDEGVRVLVIVVEESSAGAFGRGVLEVIVVATPDCAHLDFAGATPPHDGGVRLTAQV